MIKHNTFYWWNRRAGSHPCGPFATEAAAREAALEHASNSDDVLILNEMSYSGPSRVVRDWQSSR